MPEDINKYQFDANIETVDSLLSHFLRTIEGIESEIKMELLEKCIEIAEDYDDY